jgi:hypothetical protein
MVAYLPDPGSSSFTPAPPGLHRAVCYRLIDLGTHISTYQGQSNTRRQVMLTWELSDEFMDEAKPFSVSKFYTWSMGDKANLRKDLEAWRGKPFEPIDFGPNGRFNPRNLIGAPCMLNLVHEAKQNGDIRVKIAGIAPLAKGMDKPSLINPKLFFDLDNFKQDEFDQLSEKIRGMIAQSPEYATAKNGAPLPRASNHDLSDDIPF